MHISTKPSLFRPSYILQENTTVRNEAFTASFLTRAARPVPRRMNSTAGAQAEHQQRFAMPTSKLGALEILIEQLNWKSLILRAPWN